MKKENFVTLIMSVVGGLIFALGMCMALLPEWNAFTPGVVCGIIGAVVLLAMVIVRRKMTNAAPIEISGKTIGIAGMVILGLAYPIFKYATKKQREKIAPEILELINKITGDEK